MTPELALLVARVRSVLTDDLLYVEGRRRGFLTKEPSARAREVIRRVRDQETKGLGMFDYRMVYGIAVGPAKTPECVDGYTFKIADQNFTVPLGVILGIGKVTPGWPKRRDWYEPEPGESVTEDLFKLGDEYEIEVQMSWLRKNGFIP